MTTNPDFTALVFLFRHEILSKSTHIIIFNLIESLKRIQDSTSLVSCDIELVHKFTETTPIKDVNGNLVCSNCDIIARYESDMIAPSLNIDANQLQVSRGVVKLYVRTRTNTNADLTHATSNTAATFSYHKITVLQLVKYNESTLLNSNNQYYYNDDAIHKTNNLINTRVADTTARQLEQQNVPHMSIFNDLLHNNNSFYDTIAKINNKQSQAKVISQLKNINVSNLYSQLPTTHALKDSNVLAHAIGNAKVNSSNTSTPSQLEPSQSEYIVVLMPGNEPLDYDPTVTKSIMEIDQWSFKPSMIGGNGTTSPQSTPKSISLGIDGKLTIVTKSNLNQLQHRPCHHCNTANCKHQKNVIKYSDNLHVVANPVYEKVLNKIPAQMMNQPNRATVIKNLQEYLEMIG
ncbi:Hypothetical protein MVR_LOCUS143 [uncultured virus]|nr:Hypothetical protein MVR_LOCUS143 [uncultured virus]